MALRQKPTIKKNMRFAYDDYTAYISRANKHDLIVEEISGLLSSRLSDLRKYQEAWNMMDVGCGDGMLAIKLTEKIVSLINKEETYRQINFEMLDPTTEIIGKLANNISLKEWSNNVRFHYENQSIEDYLGHLNSHDRLFDVILCSHVFYHIDDWTGVLKRLLDLLKHDGWICIVLVSDQTELYQFRNQMAPILKNCDLIENDGEYVFGTDMESLLTAEGIYFNKSIRESHITFSEEDMKNLDTIYQVLGFLYRYKPEDLKERCFREIKEFIQSQMDMIPDSKGTLQFLYKDEFYWIWR